MTHDSDDLTGAGRVVPAATVPIATSTQPTSTTLDRTWTVTAVASSDRTTSRLPTYFQGRVTLTLGNGRMTGGHKGACPPQRAQHAGWPFTLMREQAGWRRSACTPFVTVRARSCCPAECPRRG